MRFNRFGTIFAHSINMKIIPLTKGKETIVDDETYDMFGAMKWCVSNGYASRRTTMSDGAKMLIYLHRIVALARPGCIVHHKNEDVLDNRLNNLQIMSLSEHKVYHERHRGHKKGKYRGVTFARREGKWRSFFCSGGRQVHIGYFDNPESAALAWDEFAWEYYKGDCFQNIR